MKELELAQNKLSENKSFFKNLSKKERKALDQYAFDAHQKSFKKYDCLSCANCCKSTGPLFTRADIDRLAKVFRIKASDFIDQYLQLDDEGDHILQKTPCVFLLENNECMVYEHRPKACREFPHTDRKNFYQIRNLTLKNTLICPIAYDVVEQIKVSVKNA